MDIICSRQIWSQPTPWTQQGTVGTKLTLFCMYMYTVYMSVRSPSSYYRWCIGWQFASLHAVFHSFNSIGMCVCCVIKLAQCALSENSKVWLLPYKWKYRQEIKLGGLVVEALNCQIKFHQYLAPGDLCRLNWVHHQIKLRQYFECLVWSQVAKFDSGQYFPLCYMPFKLKIYSSIIIIGKSHNTKHKP